jgi:hypothetical protein
MGHWLQQFFGFGNGAGNSSHYLFWSGAGSDISELALAGAVLSLLRRHNCHVRRCPRIGTHPVPGTQWLVCRHHLPGGAPTHDDVIADHLAATKGETP